MGSTGDPDVNDILQTPFKVAGHLLSHRVVLAPMTRMRASDAGIINSSAAEYYAERSSPSSLVISEGTVIHPRGKGFPQTPGLWTEEQARAWKFVTDAVHAKGGVFFVQLWHVGRVSVPSQTGGFAPFSSTSAHLPGNHLLFGDDNATEPYVDSHAMTKRDIDDVVGQFELAAQHAIDIGGFDGVEIHGANGYLLDSFVHDNINRRTDEYGGPAIENRLRFPLRVIDAVIAAIGSEKTAIRLAPFHVLQETGDSNRQVTFAAYATELEKRGLAYVHMVEPRYDQLSTEGAFSADIIRKGAGPRPPCEGGTDSDNRTVNDSPSLWPFRRILMTTPVIGAGGYDGDSARQAIIEGRIDLAAFGRHFTSNPDLPERLFYRLPLTKYQRKTFYTPGVEGYLGWKLWDAEEAQKEGVSPGL
ncbi:putative NADPH dehydrogenase [Lipomyces tetrasporus]|uniref:NADPH dehydrogenase n=1 Tax=Lipomyces tetrasporus TaxID=54092 RepID=A0AAD7QNZ5_9ASCO|nr:putative NADPH dehydrogenase [Lipomyces tetrasporus]KAJ8098937.1 putative NADPH dehydrogenase [Lipomyces tetrasporus]